MSNLNVSQIDCRGDELVLLGIFVRTAHPPKPLEIFLVSDLRTSR